MRSRMTYGNRLYVGRQNGGWEQNKLSESIARSGWAWGCATLDFDNDGFPDVYVGNGLESNTSVRDYEPECWLHDKYVNGPAALLYIKAKTARTRGREYSHGGYEKNRLYLNQRGQNFIEMGYLMGVALEKDSRNVVADDLDGDGRMDLLVSTVELWPAPKRVLHVYRNQLGAGGGWIGFRFPETSERSPIGARVTIHSGKSSTNRGLVTGDSFRSQSAATAHFGLGALESIDRADFFWPDGKTSTLKNPALNQYHRVPN